MDRGQAHVLVSGYLLQEAIGLCEKANLLCSELVLSHDQLHSLVDTSY